MTRLLLLSAAIALAAGCGEGTMIDIDKGDVEDYQDWDRIDVWGAVGGHGDSYRIIYANPKADNDTFDGVPEPGTVLVKEVHERDGDEPGDLRYIAVMRWINESDTPDGAELQRLVPREYGWLFTYLADDIDSDEEYRESCWSECHVAAPYGGLFFDYQR
jgi:hypothetical protein